MHVLCQCSTRPGALPPRCVAARPAQQVRRSARGSSKDPTGRWCRHVGTAEGAHDHVTPPADSPDRDAHAGLTVDTEGAQLVRGGHRGRGRTRPEARGGDMQQHMVIKAMLGGLLGTLGQMLLVYAAGSSAPRHPRTGSRRTGHRENRPGRRLPAAGPSGRAGPAPGARAMPGGLRRYGSVLPHAGSARRVVPGGGRCCGRRDAGHARADLAGAVSYLDDPRPP
jgi:hypothetical protein